MTLYRKALSFNLITTRKNQTNHCKDITSIDNDSNIVLWASTTGAATVGLGVSLFLPLKKRKQEE